MVDFADVSTKAVEEMKKANPDRFQHLGRYGAHSSLVSKATEAAEHAVSKAAEGTSAEGLKNIADTAFRKSFNREATSVLAKNGHPGAAVVNAGRNGLSSIGEGFNQIFRGKAKNAAGELVVKEPGRLSKSLAWLPNKIGNFAKSHPKLAFVSVGLGAVYGGARLLENRNEAKQRAEYEANMQQVAAMQQAAVAAQQAPVNPYYGGVSREEAAAMEAQMRSGGQQGGFVAAEQQRRAAASAVEQAAKA